MNLKNKLPILITLVLTWHIVAGQQDAITYDLKKNITYRSNPEDEYAKNRCRLDLSYPEKTKGFATIVWFHGGGLIGGEKYIPEGLQNKGIAVAAVNYRLSPKAEHPDYIDDTAASIAWVFNHISTYGGDPDKIYIAGHSAGGYLALMAGLDEHWLKKYNIDVNRIAGLFAISGQTITHNTIRKEMGKAENIPFANDFAPLNHIKINTPPLILITGGRGLDIPARYIENAYLFEALKDIGNKKTKLFEINGFDHTTVVDPSCHIIIREIRDK